MTAPKTIEELLLYLAAHPVLLFRVGDRTSQYVYKGAMFNGADTRIYFNVGNILQVSIKAGEIELFNNRFERKICGRHEYYFYGKEPVADLEWDEIFAAAGSFASKNAIASQHFHKFH